MDNRETVQETEEAIGKVGVPPVGGVFSQPWSMNKVFGLLAVFGPAAIVASVSIGAGETIVVVRTGAWARYGLLWLVLLSCVVKGSLRYLPARTLHSGQRRIYRASACTTAGTARLAANCNRTDGDDRRTAGLGADCKARAGICSTFFSVACCRHLSRK